MEAPAVSTPSAVTESGRSAAMSSCLVMLEVSEEGMAEALARRREGGGC